MYGTGLGQTTPAGVDDVLTPLVNFPKQVYPVSLTISRNPLFSAPVAMKVLYAGPAPGLVQGVGQIDVVVPEGVESGENFVEILAGPGGSPSITLYVQ